MADIVNELDCIDGQYAVYRWIPSSRSRLR
jgi:hypothetical protein